MRENDMVALMLFSPEASLLDLEAAGINADNTGIRDEKEYSKVKEIRENNKFKDSDGNFSESKFHEFYTDALKNYNVLAAGWQPTFHENNIFAPAKQRRTEPEFVETTILNPFQKTMSFKDLGEWGPQTKSVREIAESLKVYNTETGKWMDTPEESFFGTIGMGPLVLATWDFDADENGNPTNDPDKIKHKKGEYKLNDEGTFYYETLGGRSSHGKQLLHYSDIITKEDSSWNKIDFLDSDDIEKSVMGTVAKNVALVGSLFLPGGVGYAVTAATILLQSLKLGATLGKMLIGSEFGLFNKLESFADATDLHKSVSDYSQEHIWSWENLVQTAGDAISQLRQQRVLFEAVPWALGYGGLGKGKNLFSEQGLKALQEKLAASYNIPMKENASRNIMEAITDLKRLQLMKMQKAAAEANAITKNITEFSGAVSKAYMTGITVNDMFEEAKEAGMNDFGAMAMTLGYAAAEYALLSTGIGEMILPELRAQRAANRELMKNIVKKAKDEFEKLNPVTKEEKKNFFWKAFNVGKKLYLDNRSGTANLLTNAAVAGFGEGVEEVSEEFLADAIRVLHDMTGLSEGKMFTTKNIFDKYAMNFLGGMIGGSVNGLSIDFSTFSRIAELSPEASMRELIYKLNNGEAEEIRETIEKTNWGSKNLSSTRLMQDESGIYWQLAENEKDSLNEALKTLLRNQIDSIMYVLEANGATVSNDALFDYNTLKQARFSMLANTSTAARYSEEFYKRVLDVVENVAEEKRLDTTLTDEEKRDKESVKYLTYLQLKKELENKRKELVKGIEEIKEGKQAARFIGTALLEIHPAISQALILGPTLDLFVKRTTGRSFRDLNDTEKAEQIKLYKEYKSTLAKDDIEKAYDMWEVIMDAVQNNFAELVSIYEKELDKYSQFLDFWLELTNNLTENPEGFLAFANTFLDYLSGNEFPKLEEKIFGETKLKDELTKINEIEKSKILDIKDRAKNAALIYVKRLHLLNPDDEQHQAAVEELANVLTEILNILDEARNKIEEQKLAYEDAKLTAISDGKFSSELEYDLSELSKLEAIIKTIEDERDSKLNAIEDFEFKSNYLKGAYNGDNALIGLAETKTKLDKLLKDRDEKIADMQKEYNNSKQLEVYRFIADKFNELLDLTKLSGYLNPVTKDKLRRALKRIDYLIPLIGKFGNEVKTILGDVKRSTIPQEVYEPLWELYDQESSLIERLIGKVKFKLGPDKKLKMEVTKKGEFHKIKDKIEEVLNTPDSPILKLLDAFALDVTGLLTNFSSLFANINSILDASKTFSGIFVDPNAELITIDDITLGHIEQAIKLIDLLYSVLMGARSDSGGFELNKTLSTDVPNFGFHFGINSIINEVKEKMGDKSKPFLTIQGNITDNIVRDLHLLSNNLKFLQNLYGINSGLKLTTQSRITLHTTLILYKALKKLYDYAPEGINKNAIKDFFDNPSSVILANIDKKSVDDATLEKIEAERIKLEDALWQFGQDNKGKCIIDFSKFPELFMPSSLILNETTPEFDISSLLGYLASRFAIKSSTFYNTYKSAISEKIAPLSILELAIYLQVANGINGNAISEFNLVITQGIKDYFKSLPSKLKTELFNKIFGEKYGGLMADDLMSDAIENLLLPKYDNITFVEGIAGSGKTRAVMRMSVDIFDLIDKNIMEGAYVVDTSEDNAENLANDLGLKERKHKAFSKEQLLQHISDWEEPSSVNGDYNYVEGRDYIIEDGKFKAAYNLKEGLNDIPKVIVIDEIGRYTDLELETIDKFAKQHSISVLAFGDLDQTVSTGTIKYVIDNFTECAKKYNLKYSNDIYSVKSNISRIQLIHGAKLGFSMRTRNKQQDKNQELMLAKLIELKGDINLSYYEGQNDKGEYILNGARVINHRVRDLDEKENEVIAIIEKILPTLNKEEKIGVIFLSKDSGLYKKIIDKFGGDKFDFYLGNSAQGREARYFIYETSFTKDTPSDLIISELYTGITRALSGIIILTQNPHTSTGITNILNQEMDLSTQEITINEDTIKKFSEKRKKMYESILKDVTEKLEYKPRSSVSVDPIDKTIPIFEVINERKDGERLIIDVKPTDLGNWLSGSRTLSTVVLINCDLQGYDVKLELKDGDKTETISYSGHVTDIVNDLTLLEDDGINPQEDISQEYNDDEILDNIEGANGLKKSPKNIAPEKEFEIDDSWNESEHSDRVKEDNLQIMLYTLASMETGGVDENLNGLDPNRRDSIHGLFLMMDELFKNDYLSQGKNKELYTYLHNVLLELHSLFIRSNSRSSLDEKVKKLLCDRLKIDEKTLSLFNILFGLWTSSETNTNKGKKYGVFERSPGEKSEFNEIDSNDKNIRQLNISAVVTINDKTVMIPLAFLSSPLTLAQMKYEEDINGHKVGDYMFPEIMQILNQKDKGINEKIVEILNNKYIYSYYPSLYNLFKLWHFEHNGFFPLKQTNGKILFGWNYSEQDDFTLRSLENYGIEILTNRGMRQLIQDIYQTHLKLAELSKDDKEMRNAKISGQLIEITELLKNTLLKYSDVYMFKRAPRDTAGRQVLLGRPFIFVTEEIGNLKYNNDDKLFEAWKAGDPKVKLVYLLPPTLTFELYIKRLIDNDKNSNVPFPGNNVTSYHILSKLLKTEEGKKLIKNKLETEFSGGLNLYNSLVQIIKELDLLYNDAELAEKQAKLIAKRNNTWNHPRGKKGNYIKFITELKRSDDKIFRTTHELHDKLNKLVRLIVDKNTGLVNVENESEINNRARNILLDMNAVSIIQNALGDDFKIFDSVKFDKNSDVNDGMILVQHSNYTVNGKPFLLDVKVTTSTFSSMNLNEFIDAIVNKYTHHDGKNTKNDNDKMERNLDIEARSLLSSGILPTKKTRGKRTPSYTPSERFKLLNTTMKNLTGDNIPEKPLSKTEEDVLVTKYINLINSDVNIKGVVFTKSNGELEIISYDNTPLAALTGDKVVVLQNDVLTLKIGETEFEYDHTGNSFREINKKLGNSERIEQLKLKTLKEIVDDLTRAGDDNASILKFLNILKNRKRLQNFGINPSDDILKVLDILLSNLIDTVNNMFGGDVSLILKALAIANTDVEHKLNNLFLLLTSENLESCNIFNLS